MVSNDFSALLVEGRWPFPLSAAISLRRVLLVTDVISGLNLTQENTVVRATDERSDEKTERSTK